MKLSILSDLHLEFRYYDMEWLRSLIVPGVDVAIFAGDIMTWEKPGEIRDVLAVMSEFAPNVIYVPGNHEYYGTSPILAATSVNEALENGPSNVSVITSPRSVYVDNQRFHCGTMWYSEESIKKIANPETGRSTKRGEAYVFSDYRWVRNLVPFCYQHNMRMKGLLYGDLRPGDVVVTHHLPSPQSTPEQFKNEPDNAFFVSDCRPIIKTRRPALWVHGHTHTKCDYQYQGTRVVANPCGYPYEAEALPDFKPLTIELS